MNLFADSISDEHDDDTKTQEFTPEQLQEFIERSQEDEVPTRDDGAPESSG